jgi:hypothetical protein
MNPTGGVTLDLPELLVERLRSSWSSPASFRGKAMNRGFASALSTRRAPHLPSDLDVAQPLIFDRGQVPFQFRYGVGPLVRS